MMRAALLFALSSLVGVALVDARLAVKAPKFSILSSSDSVLKSGALEVSPDTPSPLVVTVGNTDTLKLSFTVVDDEEGSITDAEGIQPHQAFLRFSMPNGVEGIQPVKVSSSGKARFELNVRKPPPGIPATEAGDGLDVELILGSFQRTSSRIPLFALKLPSSLPVAPHAEEKYFHPQHAIYHTFREAQKVPPQTISLAFVGIALSPWIVLLGLLSHLPVKVAPSASTAPFIVLLAAFEGLLVWYWVDLRLGQVLLYGAGLGLVTAAAGNRALSSLPA